MGVSPIDLIEEKSGGGSQRQSHEKEQYKSKLIRLFQRARDQRTRSYKHFNGANLLEYIETNHSLSMGYVGDVEVDEWQANTSTNLVRNKFIAVLAFLLEQLIQPEVLAQNGKFKDARMVARDIEELLNEQMNKNKYFQKYLDVLIEAVAQGTVFVDTGYAKRMRGIKEIESIDLDTGKTKYKKKDIVDFEGLFMKVVPLHEVYLGNMFTKEMEDQPFIFRRIQMDYFEAEKLYGRYADWDMVSAYESTEMGTDDEPDYRFFDETELVAGDVEVIMYQNKSNDEMAIIANGVLLTDIDTPLPYHHKEYTIVKGMFNPFPDTEFAYGKSLAHEQMFNQEVADTLLNMIIDKTYLSIFPPLVTLGREEVTSDVIIPGAITPMKDTTVNRIDGVGEPVGGSEFNVLQQVMNLQEQATPPQAGQASTPRGGAVTASQVLAQQQDAVRLMGLFGFMIAFLIEEISNLWIQNMFQFMFAPEVQDDRSVKYKQFFLPGRQVFQEKRKGVLDLRLAPTEEFPRPQELFKEEEQFEQETGIPKMIRIVDPEYIRDYDLVVHVQANPKQRRTKALDKALEFDFFQTFVNNPLVNQQQLIRGIMDVFDKDADDYIVDQTQEQAALAQQGGIQPEGQAGGELGAQLQQGATAPLSQPSLQQLVQAG